MKTLLLMRHAKSSWDDPDLADHDRPLNKRGKRDAPRMGRWLARQDLVPDVMVSSTAVRARSTAEKLAGTCGYGGEVVCLPQLYHATPSVWRSVVRELAEPHARVLCIGHNPGLEELLLDLLGEVVAMPTAAVAYVTFEIDRWAELNRHAATSLRAVWRPKDIDLPDDE
jgi:phosphohistidine phosphatase